MVQSEQVAEAIWGRKPAPDERTWELMWFFDNLVPLNAPGELVRVELGRAEGARFQNFAHVRAEAEDRLRVRYGSIEGFVEYIAQQPVDLATVVRVTAAGDGAATGTALDEATAVLTKEQFRQQIRDLTQSLPPAERTQTRKNLQRRYDVRDWLKSLYDNCCQVCGFRFEKRGGGWY
jgi:hypothetical protein